MRGQPEVGAEHRDVALRQQAAPHERRDDGYVQAARKRGHSRLDAEAADLDADHHHRPRGARNAVHDFVGAGGDFLRIERVFRLRDHPAARSEDHVARELEVDGPRVLETAAQHARDLTGRVGRIVEQGLVAGDLAIDRKLRVGPLHLVVQRQAAARLAAARRTRDHHQRRFLGVGRRDRVDHVERTGAVGDDRHAWRAADTCRRVRRESDRGLVAQRVQRQQPRLFDDLEERQHEVAWDAEHLPGAVLLQGRQ